MNKKRIIKIAVISSVAAIFILYFINLIYRIYDKRKTIDETEIKITELYKDIRKEIKNQKVIEKTNKDFLKTAYFDKKERYFENYIRNLFDKYRIKINIYQSKMNEKNYSELDVGFTANAFNFFKLIKDAEEGEKIIVIKTLTMLKQNIPNLKVTVKLGGYYKE